MQKSLNSSKMNLLLLDPDCWLISSWLNLNLNVSNLPFLTLHVACEGNEEKMYCRVFHPTTVHVVYDGAAQNETQLVFLQLVIRADWTFLTSMNKSVSRT